MKLDDIIEFANTLKSTMTLPTEFEDDLRTFVGKEYYSISIDGLRYSVDIQIRTNKEFVIDVRDYLTEMDIISDKSTFSSLNEIIPYWEKVVDLLNTQQSLPHGYVKFSSYRALVMHFLESLSDEAYQQQAWINHQYPEGKVDDFSSIVNWFDDFALFPPFTHNTIGYTLRNKAEADAMLNLTKALEDQIEKLGRDAPDIEHLKDSDWKHIVKLAGKALRIMRESDKNVSS